MTYLCKNIFLLIALEFFLTGCSGPSTDIAENTLRQYIESQSGRQIKLTSFNKTDGQETKVFGVTGYNMSFEGEITFASDGVWYKNNVFAGSGLTFSFSQKAEGFTALNGATQVHAGNKVKIGGVMAGQKSENGWNFNVADVHTIN